MTSFYSTWALLNVCWQNTANNLSNKMDQFTLINDNPQIEIYLRFII